MKLTAHTSGEFTLDEAQSVAALEASVIQLNALVADAQNRLDQLETSERAIFDIARFQDGFSIRNSSNDPVNELYEGETYILSQPWFDWQGNYAFDNSTRMIELSASIGIVSFIDEISGIRYYTYNVPALEADQQISFSGGKYTDDSLTNSLLAVKTVTANDVFIPTSPTLTLSRSGDVVTAKVHLPQNAPCAVYWRVQGSSTWILRSPTFDTSYYGAAVPYRQSFTVPIGVIIEVYAEDRIGNTYVTGTSSISIPNNLGQDLTGFTDFLNVGTTPRAQGEVTTSLFNGYTAPLNNFQAQPYNENMTVAITDDIWSLGAVMLPTPNGSYSTTQIRSAHNINPATDVSLFQRFYIPNDMDWGGVHPFTAGSFGMRIAGGAAVTQQDNTEGFKLLPIWNGLPEGGAELGFRLYGADQSSTLIKGTNSGHSFNNDTPRTLSPGWHTLLIRVKMNSAPSATDGTISIRHNAEEVYNSTGRQLISAATPQIDNFSMITYFFGRTGESQDWAPSKTQTFFYADWKYRIHS